MSDAKTLLKEFLGNIGNPEKAAALFAEDGVFEMSFFVSLGLPTRFNGLWASRASSPPSLTATATSSSTTRTSPSSSTPRSGVCRIRHSRHSRSDRSAGPPPIHGPPRRSENGQIPLLREALNTVAAASALLPGDTDDLPEPTNEIYA